MLREVGQRLPVDEAQDRTDAVRHRIAEARKTVDFLTVGFTV